MIACPSCATECPDGSRFCLSCGAPLATPRPSAAERKLVTTMFCDLVDFTALCEEADSEDVDRLLREFYALARRVIETYGGVVEKYVGDAVVGVFGVPTAHEDDAERSVHTALRLLDGVPSLPQITTRPNQVRVGISTGAAVVRLDVHPGSGQGFLVGDAVNTAARLQALAPPMGIVVGEKTRALSARSIAYEALTPVKVKGKRRPVDCWLVQGPIARMGIDLGRQFAAPLIGREVELSILKGLLKKVRSSSQPRFAMIVGEAGVGKSRLIHELARYVDSRPFIVRWRQGRCPSYGDGLTFWALGEIVKEQLGVGEFDDAATVDARLGEALSGQDDRDWLAARVRPLIGLESSTTSREENFAAWQRFIELIARDHPAVLVFEDLQWASEASLAFLRHLVEHTCDVPLLVIGITRPELLQASPDLAARLADFAASQRALRLDLAPLSEPETQELIRLTDPRLGDLPKTRRAIVRRAAGNPLFAEQLVRHLEVEPSAAGEALDDVALKESAAEALPESLRSLIAARLDELPPDRKALLSDAAVVGEVFWLGAVAAIDPGDREAATAGLKELAQSDFVQPRRDSSISGEKEFAFRHSLIRDVAYEELARGARAAKHAAAAHWVEARAGERVDEVAEILAYHYTTALTLAQAARDEAFANELREATVQALKLAGDRALPLDVKAGERHYAKAVELAGDSGQRPHMLVAWAEALVESGRLEEAVDALDEGVTGLRALGEDRAAKVASTRSWYVHWLLADGQSVSAADVAELADGDEVTPELVTVLEQCAGRVSYGGQSTLAVRLADRAAAICAELQLPESLRAVDIRGNARCALGEVGGLDDLRHALDLARARDVGHWVCVVESNLGESLNVFEGPDAALRVHRRALELAQRRSDELAICFCRYVLFVDLVWAGQWDAAFAEADDLDRLLEERKDLWDLVLARATHALLCAWRGDIAGAAERAAWAEERSRGTPIVATWVACLISCAAVEAGLGDEEATLRFLNAGASLLNEADGTDSGCALRMPEAIRLAMRLRDPRLAQDLARGLPAARPFDAATLTVLEALLREQRGDYGGAAERFARAKDQWARLGVSYEHAQAALGLGRCLAALGNTTEAATALTSARDVLETLGARPALGEAAALLEALPQ